MENSFILNVHDNINHYFLVYSLHDEQDVLLYVGISKLANIISLADIKKHPLFSKFFSHRNRVKLTILAQFKDKHDAQNWQYFYLRDKEIPSEMRYLRAYRGKVAVRCIDTGEIFDSITDCANAHGISASNLSKHLRGDPNYRTVGGKRYEHAMYTRTSYGGYVPCSK